MVKKEKKASNEAEKAKADKKDQDPTEDSQELDLIVFQS